MVCATTTSVAHILHRSKTKNKQNQILNSSILINKTKLKNQRSMSQSTPTNRARIPKRIFQIGRVARSNSTVCGTDMPPIKRLLAVAKTQQKKSINKHNDVLLNNKNFQNQLLLNISTKQLNNNLLFKTKNVPSKAIIVIF